MYISKEFVEAYCLRAVDCQVLKLEKQAVLIADNFRFLKDEIETIRILVIEL